MYNPTGINFSQLATDDTVSRHDTLFCRIIVVKYLCTFNYAMGIPSATSLLAVFEIYP